MEYNNILPFSFAKNPSSIYMGYGQNGWNNMVPQDRALEDLEYLSQMYPTYSRKYQGMIKSMMGKMDYDGSFIYDQYPDRITFMRMVESAMKIIHENEKNNENIDWEDNEPWIKELVTVIMYNEILTMRRKKNRYIY
jgi:adenylate kinase family enzyme